MGWIEGDIARIFCLVIFLLVISESKGLVAHSPVISHSKPAIVSHLVQKIVPSVLPNAFSENFSPAPELSPLPSLKDLRSRHVLSIMIVPTGSTSHPPSSLPHAIKEHNSERETNPQGNQAPDFPHVTAPSPRMLPFNPQNVLPNSRGIHPTITTSSSAKGFKESRITYKLGPAPAISPTEHSSDPLSLHSPTSQHSALIPPAQNSKKREIYTPYPKNEQHYASPPYDIVHVISPPVNPPILTPKHKRSLAPSPHIEGPKISPAHLHPLIETSKRNKRHHAPSSYHQGPHLPPRQAPTSTNPPSYIIWQIHPPHSSPSQTSRPKQSLPPPPPNLDCGHLMCQSPLTNPCFRSPCTCVLPIKVSLRLGVALYIFFPLVSKFAQEIATGVSMKQWQVRIMGANSAIEDSEKTDVLIDLVPLGKSFGSSIGLMTFEKFWKKQVSIQTSYFGDYVVLYVNYPGLPPSPPTAAYLNGQAYANNNNGRTNHPLGVDVRKKKKKLGGSVIAIIAMTSLIVLVLVIGAAWLLLLRNKELSALLKPKFLSTKPPFAKPSAAGIVPMNVRIGPSSTSASLSSNIATYNGSTKTFTLAEMERATNGFDDVRVVGEGGFGRVYQGTLECGTMVAVKVLKRDDKQGEREFLSEVEMLCRLHHRNLVKLIGICTEESVRCLVYELIPNGSVESHLHGIHKETTPLDWNARVKIALGAAQALAYLHEDSSPPVIHRDFKSSNILLQHDFTPRVSDFGLARSPIVEGMEHISTCVMGTFGYVDPEYAMTGHLLAKSDVYSYGVVLLELLTGRKPIDMSRRAGQENLVAWTRSLLGNKKRLPTIIDPVLGANYPQNSVAKLAAIASMCVHPEVSHRPLMSEIVQALKLVWNESDEHSQSESCNQDEMSVRDVGVELCQGTDRELFYASSRFTGDVSGSFRRDLGSGSSSKHGFVNGFWLRRH